MAIKVIICLVLGYIFGCFQTGYFYGKLFKGIDVRNYGSGNAGLTNFYRVFGKQKILLVILADVLKTVIAVLAGAALFHWAGNDPIIGKLLGGLQGLQGFLGEAVGVHPNHPPLYSGTNYPLNLVLLSFDAVIIPWSKKVSK